MNNNSYHEAGRKVLNWRRLSIYMKARYGGWKAESDCSWTARYTVTVTHQNGKRLKQDISYPFEKLADAELCLGWWKENGCLAVLETL
jgi:hypothetical protein